MRKTVLCFLILITLFGCSNSDKPGNSSTVVLNPRTTVTECLLTEASGTSVIETEVVKVDYSNINQGYLMILYTGEADKVKVRVSTPTENTYTYTLNINGEYSSFPLTCGNGKYRVELLEHAYDNLYAVAYSEEYDVQLVNEYVPFLYPNQYVQYSRESNAVEFGIDLSNKASDDLNYVELVYKYVLENINYDTAKAQSIPLDYIPDIDKTMKEEKGICFDYAALMTALLRSQGIPTKLVVGYSGEVYHAWINVFIDEIGWIDQIIQFDGQEWSLMDPTLAANNDNKHVMEYIGDSDNYQAKYFY